MGHPGRVGPYEVLSPIAQGGMGVVYRARHSTLPREVALKLLRSGSPLSEAQRKRFLREASLLARLRHPAIIGIHDAGEHQGCPYVVMDLIEGGDLQATIDQQGPLAVERAVAIARALADALTLAHEGGVIHRDIKPANVLLDAKGRPYLADFGLAKDVDASRVSKTGQFLGSPGFWPPEQAQGETEVGPAADVYALGGTLHAMLTGRPPFEGSSLIELLNAALQEPARAPSDIRPEVPPELDGVVLRCLEKRPADRYPSMAALVAALDQLAPGRAPPASEAPASPRAVAAGAVVGLLVGLGCAAGTWAVAAGRAADEREEASRVAATAQADAAAALARETDRRREAEQARASLVGQLRQAELERDTTRDLAREAEQRASRATRQAQQLQRAIDAEAAARRAEEEARRPKPPADVQARARELRSRAAGKLQAGDATGAITDYTAAIELEPLSSAYVNRGVAQNLAAKLEAAVADYGEAIRLDPTNAMAFLNRARVCNQLGRWEQAIQDFDRATALDPKWRSLAEGGKDISRDGLAGKDTDEGGSYSTFEEWVKSAKEFLDMGNFRGARLDFTAALKLRPDDLDTLLGRAAASEAILDRPAASADYERVLSLKPDEPRAERARRGLERLSARR